MWVARPCSFDQKELARSLCEIDGALGDLECKTRLTDCDLLLDISCHCIEGLLGEAMLHGVGGGASSAI